CEREDFRPRRSALCGYCAFQAYCPVFGGDPEAARRLAEERAAEADGGGEGVPVAVGQAGAAGADDPAPNLAPLTPSPASCAAPAPGTSGRPGAPGPSGGAGSLAARGPDPAVVAPPERWRASTAPSSAGSTASGGTRTSTASCTRPRRSATSA